MNIGERYSYRFIKILVVRRYKKHKHIRKLCSRREQKPTRHLKFHEHLYQRFTRCYRRTERGASHTGCHFCNFYCVRIKDRAKPIILRVARNIRVGRKRLHLSDMKCQESVGLLYQLLVLFKFECLISG